MYHQYVQQMKDIQNTLMEFIDSRENVEEKFQNLRNKIQDQKIHENQTEMQIFFRLIMNIANYHYRSDNFFSKIEKVILLFKNDIMNKFSNSEIYDIFQSNKRVLLFLLEEKILNLDQNISNIITLKSDYINYFYPEISSLNDNESNKSNTKINQQTIDQYTTNQDSFLSKRKKGENDSYICQLIKEDDIDKFISYVSKNGISLNSNIEESIFETNLFLLEKKDNSNKNNINLIQYASFFGSIQIFKYLYLNQAQLDISVWDYAIHGCDPELIHILEEKKLQANKSNPNLFYEKLFELSIQFFNNEISEYIQKNYLAHENSIKSIKYMNFNYFPENISTGIFNKLCKNGYFTIIDKFLQKNKIDIEAQLLFAVIKHGHLNILQLLLKNGSFDINLIEKVLINKNNEIYMNFNLLSYSVFQKKIDIVDFLLKQENIDVNLYCERKDKKICYKKTALHMAIEKNSQEIVKLLIEHPNIDINIERIQKTDFSEDYDDCYDNYEFGGEIDLRESSLFIAVKEDKKEIIEILLKNDKIDVNKKSYCHCSYSYDRCRIHGSNSFSSDGEGTDEQTILYKAIEIGDEQIINLLLNHPKIDINLESNVIEDLDSIINLINNLKSGISVDDDDINTKLIFDSIKKLPINICIKYKDENVLETLLSRPDLIIDSNSNLLFKFSVSCGNMKLLNLLLNSNKFDRNSGLKNSLQVAIKTKNLDIFNFLLNLPEINVNDCPPGGTALEIAIKNKSMDFVKILLDRPDIDININSNKKTALKTAVKYDNKEAFVILLDQPGINVNDNSNNETALKIAVKKENLEFVKLLLNHPGINVNDNSNNETALKIAVKKENHEFVKLLLNHPGINVNDDSNDETALQIAAEKKNIDLVNLLITNPEIEFDPENIYKDVDREKLRIILILVEAKKKKNIKYRAST